jgi:hypothetical protein
MFLPQFKPGMQYPAGGETMYRSFSSLIFLPFIFVLLAPASVEAQAIPPEFQVNTTTAGNQSGASIGMNGQGLSVVVWSDGSVPPGRIASQRYDQYGTPLGSETILSTQIGSSSPSAAMGPSHFVVAWDWMDMGVTEMVDGQLYDINGTPIGAQFSYLGRDPSVAMHSSGSFVLVWERVDTLNINIIGRRFDSFGNPVGSEFVVNSYIPDSQESPSVAMDASGNFVVVWQSSGQDGSTTGIFGQRFDNLANKIGPEFQVNTYTNLQQDNPDVAVDALGNFAVVWQSNQQDGSSQGVYAQRYTSAGIPVGGEFRINQETNGQQGYPSVAMNDGSDMIVAWASQYQDGDNMGVFARRFDPTSAPLEDEFQVNVYTTNMQISEDVGMDDSGDFVVIWESYGQDGDAYGEFGRRYIGFADVPTLSQWGLIALLLLVLTAGTLIVFRRRARSR